MKTRIRILLFVCLLAAAPFSQAETLLDFDGDRKSDFVVIRNNGTTREWHISRSSDGAYIVIPWGSTNAGWWDQPVPADYDGDGKTDAAIWRRSAQPGQSAFWILNSSDGTFRVEYLGEPGDLVNVWGDYDGDGKADPAVYYRSTWGRNMYLYRGSLNNPSGVVTSVVFGMGMDYIPYRGDFDGDGKFDFCLRSNSNATFSLKRSSDGGIETIAFGKTNDIIAPGDYDGDGRTDFCVSRLGKGYNYNWYILERDGGGTGFFGITWGKQEAAFHAHYSGADFDGDGRGDIAVYVFPGYYEFRIRKSSDYLPWIFQWGGGSNADNTIQINYGF
jgi:hypothetical protein